MAYTGEIWRNTRGGIETGNVYLDNIDLTFSHEFAADDGASTTGGRLFAYLLATNGNQLSAPLVGDFQVVSNIDNTATARLYEFWYESDPGAAASVKLGLMDLWAFAMPAH